MRLFIAINVSEEVRRNLMSVMNELQRVWRGVRWVRQDGIHLTLKFLGEVDEKRMDAIVKALKVTASNHDPFHAEVEALGRFPERGRPRVVWSGVKEERGLLKRLAQEVEMSMEREGFERETREFRPHITLGRVKVPGQDEAGLSFLEEHRMTRFGPCEIDRFDLMKSTLLPDGARYEKLGSFLLGKND